MALTEEQQRRFDALFEESEGLEKVVGITDKAPIETIIRRRDRLREIVREMVEIKNQVWGF